MLKLYRYLAVSAVFIVLWPQLSYANPKSSFSMDAVAPYLELRGQTQSAQQRQAIDETLKAQFEQKLAILVTDTSGMTTTTKQKGIYEMLVRIRTMHQISKPLIAAHNATLVKTFADDMMIIHTSAATLYRLANEIIVANRALGIRIAAGISYGSILYLEDDIWGDAVNIASKLGEDLAAPDEILLSEDAFEQLLQEKACLRDCDVLDDDMPCGTSHIVCHAH